MIDVLAFGAHPDDAEIGCGGALAAAVLAGRSVAIADASAGEAATHGTREGREKERLRAADVLGLAARPNLGLPDGEIGRNPRDLEVFAAVIAELRPKIVLAPYVEDRHPDHAAVGKLVREATFLATVRARGLPRARVYHYMIHHPFPPSFVLDVSSVWDRKMEALHCYEQQFTPAEPHTEIASGFLEVVEARGVYFGSLIGAAHGEPFWSQGPVPLSVLPDLPGAAARRYRAL